VTPRRPTHDERGESGSALDGLSVGCPAGAASDPELCAVLRQRSAPLLPPEFRAELGARLRAESALRRRRRLGGAVAVAAALLLCAGLGLWIARPGAEPAAFAAGQTVALDLALSGGIAAGTVHWQVELPAGVRLHGAAAGARVLEWAEPLPPEGLRRSLPLQVDSPGTWSIPVRARVGQEVADGTLQLVVAPRGAQLGANFTGKSSGIVLSVGPRRREPTRSPRGC